MQILYRCSDATGQALTAEAGQKGISRNALMDQIMRKHLKKSRRESGGSGAKISRQEAQIETTNAAAEVLLSVMDAVLELKIQSETDENPSAVSQKIDAARADIITKLDEVSRLLGRR